jgi:hypothetical protein
MSAQRKQPDRNVDGAPEIARPNKQQGAFIRALFRDAPHSALDKLNALFNELLPYEKQLAFVYAWFLEMWEVLESDDEKTANEARVELQSLFRKHVGQLLRQALSNKHSEAKQWAGMILANIGSTVRKYDEKLSETNSAYLAEKNKIISKSTRQLGQVLFPKLISEVVQRELKTAESHRKTLKLLKAGLGKGWKEAARRQNIPEAYWVFAELDPFLGKSESEWWTPLWSLIRENNPDLLQKLRERSNRAKRVDPGDARSGTIKIDHPWSKYANEFRHVLRSIARHRDSGVL